MLFLSDHQQNSPVPRFFPQLSLTSSIPRLHKSVGTLCDKQALNTNCFHHLHIITFITKTILLERRFNTHYYH